jgi:hypothetical protein
MSIIGNTDRVGMNVDTIDNQAIKGARVRLVSVRRSVASGWVAEWVFRHRQIHSSQNTNHTRISMMEL